MDDTEPDDRDRVFAEAPAASVGGLWFTPDESAPGGVRVLTESELRAITDRVRATQAAAVADQIETADRYPDVRSVAGWADDVPADADEQERHR